jgi:hypothetical protein
VHKPLQKHLNRLDRVVQLLIAKNLKFSTGFVFVELLEEWDILLEKGVNLIVGSLDLEVDYLAMTLVKRTLQKPLITVESLAIGG